MISKSQMHHESTRLFALAQLLDTTHTIAFSAVSEGSDDYEGVLQRVHELLFAAIELAHNAAHELSELISECDASSTPNTSEAEARS